MSGKDYLKDIKTNLESGRHQHRMGENILRAFGYVRRRRTAIEEINTTLNCLGLMTEPSLSVDMPLRKPRITFSLNKENAHENENAHESVERFETTAPNSINEPTSDADKEGIDDDDTVPPEPAFSVSELASAETDVECVSPNATIREAYTKMLLNKYSQLVVASNSKPLQQDIKGIVSFQSMAKALMSGEPKTVGNCTDNDVQIAQYDADLKSVVSQLSENDVVLVIGRDRRLQGIVTAWDLAQEFAGLVDPFRRIGEIEERLRSLVGKRLGKDKVSEFLNDHVLPGANPIEELEELTMGELQRVLSSEENWDALALPFDRKVFISSFNEAREYRNRLMHFKEPLNEEEMQKLTNLCHIVREIQL